MKSIKLCKCTCVYACTCADVNKNRKVTIAVSHDKNTNVVFSLKYGKPYEREEVKGKTIFRFRINNVEKVDWWLKENVMLNKLHKV